MKSRAGSPPRPGRPDLVLTGGETARTTLDALGIRELEPLGEIHHGAVHSRTPDGRRVVTRPGSYGAEDSLLRIVAALRPRRPPSRQPSEPSPSAARLGVVLMSTPLPLIAVTMGDGAGDRPRGRRRGPARRRRPDPLPPRRHRRRAAAARGRPHPRPGLRDRRRRPPARRRVHARPRQRRRPRPAPRRPALGQAVAGRGRRRVRYIKRAAELAVAGDVHAICTAPLNKEALHAAGHIYPGHTELLAHLTGTEEVSMMLSTEKVKVIHVTTHIGLIDAVEPHRAGPRRAHRAPRPRGDGPRRHPEPRHRRLRHQPARGRERPVRLRRGGARRSSRPWRSCAPRASTPAARSPPTPPSSSPRAATTT